MNECPITIPYIARYYTLGALNDNPEQEVWIIFHGYGQLAEYFIQKFEKVAKDGAFVVAPEGMSLFYLEGTEGRVGASWMTREFREQTISNYTTYLQQLYQEQSLHNKKVVLFSFSQGGATLIRWVVHHQISFQKMIFWAGGFPPDVDPEASRKVFSNRSLFYVYGDQDQYITPERMMRQKELFRQFGFYPEVIRFKGQHVIDLEVLEELQKKSRPR